MSNAAAAIRTALDDLAAKGNAKDIAEHLLAEGHRGYRDLNNCCPVAEYLRAKTGESVEVDPERVWGVVYGCFDADCTCDGPDCVSVPTPPAVAGFIARFDEGLFPKLDKAVGPDAA